MGEPMKIRTVTTGDITEIRVLVPHPMESGQRKNPAGETIPAHYIQTLTISVGGRMLIDGQLNTAIARNPVFAFRARGLRPGERIKVAWTDNRGDSRSDEASVA